MVAAAAPAGESPLAGLSRPLIGAVVALAALGAVALPLATYTTTLAGLGLAHVLSELRYLDGRFGRRLGLRLRWALAALLAGVVGLRAARLATDLPGAAATALELGLVLALTVVVLPSLARSLGALLAGLGATAALAIGLAVSPVHALLTLAVLHNATPLGFLAERLEGPARRRALAVGVLLFAAVPALIATGLPFRALWGAGLAAPEAALLPVGGLASHLGAYLPRELHAEPWALHAFSAFVFMQCMHYLSVIYVLPRLQRGRDEAPSLPWPAGRLFALTVAGLAVGLLAHFWLDFGQARSLYGVAAAVHAHVEWPLLLLALAPGAAAPGGG